MSMVINTNMSALSTTNSLNKNTTAMNSSLQKLSTGYSINSAADDSAGLAISEKMRSQIQGLDQASNNSQDATSLTQTADGALDETTSILKRMRELAVKSSSDTLTDSDRTSIQDETDSLRQEIDRISNDTEYNTKKLINGDSGSSTAISGKNSAAITATATQAGNNTLSGDYSVKYTATATQATTGLSTASTSGLTNGAAVVSAYAGDVSINGTTITIASGDTMDGVLQKINDQTGTTGVTATLDTTTSGNSFIKLTDDNYGKDSQIKLKADNTTLDKLFHAVDTTTSTGKTATSVTTNGTDAAGTINGAAATATGNTLTAFDLTVTGDDKALQALADQKTDLGTYGTDTDDLSAAKTAADAAYTAADTAFTSTDTAITTAKTALNGATAYTDDYKTKAATLAKAVADSTDTAAAALYTTYISTKSTANGVDAAAAADATPGTTTVAQYLAKATATADVTVDASSALTFQVGANSNQTMNLSIGDMDANSLGVAGKTSTTGIDLTSADSATKAIKAIDAAISKVSAERSNLGAVQNSLESNINNLDTESENLTSAESNIRDTDMAAEMANYTKLSVVTQAATAMLSKANQQPSKVLNLLQS